jgi:alpha-L-rhamnosidase
MTRAQSPFAMEEDFAEPVPMKVLAPTFEQHHDGFGVMSTKPRVSWRFAFLDGKGFDWQQCAYDMVIKFAGENQSFKYHVKSSNSVLEPWPARGLKSGQQAQVRVRCWGSGSAESAGSLQLVPSQWSTWSTVEAALLHTSDWTAKMITASPTSRADDGSVKPLRFSTSFELPEHSSIQRARLYTTAHGCYSAVINDRAVGDQCMAPGWQSYKHRLHYQVFDVKKLLQNEGPNFIQVDVGAGWFASALAWAGGRRCFFGKDLGLLAQLRIVFDDDDVADFVLGTDDRWQWRYSSISKSEIYNGETYDMTLDGIQDHKALTASNKVSVVDFDFTTLVCPETPPVRVTQEIKPVEISKSTSGKTIVDFGQNVVGRIRALKLQKPEGHIVTFRHAEVMEDGELGVRPLRDAKATDYIVCNGDLLEDWTPKFTFHGFRYVEVTGWSSEDADCPLLPQGSIVAQVLHSDMERTGWFSCSHPSVNKLHENTMWSMRGNFLSIPTDCPQRNERLGWTGDIQVFAPSANFLFNTTGLLGNWLEDLAAEQMEPQREGIPPFVVPDVITMAHADDHDFWPHLPNAVWDDAAVLVPWSLYLASGDQHILEKQFQSMTTWIDHGIRRGSDGLWDINIYQLGDWLDPMAPPSEPGNGRTDGTFVADAYLLRVTAVMAEACAVLGRSDSEMKYRTDYERLKSIFHKKYVAASGLLVADTQTAYSLVLAFKLIDDVDQLRSIGERLTRSVSLQQFRVSTGFAGTPIITHALTAVCEPQMAYRMLLEKNCPSWMYPISMGATTIWERWDSMLADGSINPGDMTSFNHYALGSIVNWLHECVGGISPLEPGWKKIKIRPVPGGGLTHANVAHVSAYGKIECSWSISEAGTKFHLDLMVPPNSSAWVILPNEQKKAIKEEEKGHWVSSGRHFFDIEIMPAPWPPKAIMPPFWPQKAAQLA